MISFLLLPMAHSNDADLTVTSAKAGVGLRTGFADRGRVVRLGASSYRR
jgi:hypothetical protein